MIRCTVAFAQAVFDGEMTVEGVTARLATSSAEAMKLTERGFIPVMVDPTCSLLDELKPLAWWTLFWRNRIWVRGQIWHQ